MASTSATTAIPERPGGLRRELRFWEAIALSLGIMAPTAAMALNGVAPAGLIGRAVPLAFLFAAIAIALVSYAFVRLTGHFSHAGSAYALTGVTLGPHAGFFSGWGQLGTYTAFTAASTAEVGLFGEAFFDGTGIWHSPEWIVISLVAAATDLDRRVQRRQIRHPVAARNRGRLGDAHPDSRRLDLRQGDRRLRPERPGFHPEAVQPARRRRHRFDRVCLRLRLPLLGWIRRGGRARRRDEHPAPEHPGGDRDRRRGDRRLLRRGDAGAVARVRDRRQRSEGALKLGRAARRLVHVVHLARLRRRDQLRRDGQRLCERSRDGDGGGSDPLRAGT